MSTPLPDHWRGLVDDAAIFPPGEAPLPDAVRAYGARGDSALGGLVASFVVTDERLPEAAAAATDPALLPCSVVVTGGAGAVAGAARLARRRGVPVHAVEIALRDRDDLAANARRVLAATDAARAEGLLDERATLFVEIPGPVTAHWLRAADEVAAAEARLKLRTGGLEPDLFPSSGVLASWVDAALDRETPFKCTAGLHHAVRHTDPHTGFEHHGFLNLLLATLEAFDGAGSEQVLGTLEERDGAALAARADAETVGRARRWFGSFGSCSVAEPFDDLHDLGLVEGR